MTNLAKAIDASTPGVQQESDDDEVMAEYSTVESMITNMMPGKYYTKDGKKRGALISIIEDIINFDKSKNKILFLQTVMKAISPGYKPWAPGQKIKPGTSISFAPPEIPLPPSSKKFKANPAAQKKAEELTQIIDAYQKELAELQSKQNKLQILKVKAEKEKQKSTGQIREKTLKYFAFIDKHCSQYIKSVKEVKKLLYRGQDDDSQQVFVGNPRDNREPKDSDREAQELFDKCLSILGFKALRGNSIFTSSDKGQASSYGDTYAIFPVNGFNFAWSKDEGDLILDSTEHVLGRDDDDDMYDTFYEYEDTIDMLHFHNMYDLKEWFYDEGFDEDDEAKVNKMAKAIMANPSFKECMKAVKKWDNDVYDGSDPEEIHSQYIKIMTAYNKIPKSLKFKPLSGYELTDANKKLTQAKKDLVKAQKSGYSKSGKVDKTLAQQVVKRFGYTKDNFTAALKSGNEVIINGNFIAMEWAEFSNEIHLYYGVKKGFYS